MVQKTTMPAGASPLVVFLESLAVELGSASSVVLGLLLIGAGLTVLYLGGRRPRG
jgi:hypothetical protein